MTISTGRGQGRGTYERSELHRLKQSLPYVEARVEKYKKLLDEEIKNLHTLYRKQDQLEEENA